MKVTIMFFSAAVAGSIYLFQKKDEVPVRNQYADRTIVYCSPSFDPAVMNEGNAPLLDGFGKWNYPVTTKNKKAAQYFNQGIALLYGFNHGEAGRSFKTALKLDSTMAMAYWGIAMVLGPNYNAALDPSQLADINAAVDHAVEYAATTAPHEQALINAIAKRFPRSEVKDMMPYYESYASAMKEAHDKFPDDAQIGTLYADALMNMHPWDLWVKDGTARPWTADILATLEKTLKKYPAHPGAIHYYIHATEASKNPGRATSYADKLTTLMPGAGHLVHMPSHVYIRTGEYHKGVLVNELASNADSSYIAQCKVQGAYPLVYYPHNIHFLAACAFLEGNSKKAMNAAWAIARKANKEFMHQFGAIQHYSIIPYYMLVQLGRWNEILKLTEPSDSFLYPKAIWHYARGMAYAAKGEPDKANTELVAVRNIAKDENVQKVTIWDMNKVSELINIASYTLEGEILAKNGQYDSAIGSLTKAVELEDALMYQEPPDWFFSVRLSLGHWLNEAKRFREAEQVYREDLGTFPANGWALKGLYNSLKGQGKNTEASSVHTRFQAAWKWADIRLSSSRVL
jgi:tetratricopeptide (TPR) repeat protein